MLRSLDDFDGPIFVQNAWWGLEGLIDKVKLPISSNITPRPLVYSASSIRSSDSRGSPWLPFNMNRSSAETLTVHTSSPVLVFRTLPIRNYLPTRCLCSWLGDIKWASSGRRHDILDPRISTSVMDTLLSLLRATSFGFISSKKPCVHRSQESLRPAASRVPKSRPTRCRQPQCPVS
jgi:hypothetical protein